MGSEEMSARDVLPAVTSASGVEPERVELLESSAALNDSGHYVLYWMRVARRVQHNESLTYAAALANHLDAPLVVLAIVDTEAMRIQSIRHALFLLEGLQELDRAIPALGASFFVRLDPSYAEAGTEASYNVAGPNGFGHRAKAVVTDMPHMRPEVDLVRNTAGLLQCPFVSVETELIVPVDIVTDRHETDFAEFLQTKWKPKIGLYLRDLAKIQVAVSTRPENLEDLGWGLEDEGSESTRNWDARTWLSHQDKLKEALQRAGVDVDVLTEASPYKGGETSAKKLLQVFVARKIKGYANALSTKGEDNRAEFGSLLSPYLTFGFISPITITLKILAARGVSEEDKHAVLSNLARREASYNMVRFVEDYESYENIVPSWAREHLEEHAVSRTERYQYSLSEWETAQTHDAGWNAVQNELLTRGRNCGLNRRFWCNRIIEYEPTPKAAFDLARKLNDKYMLDAGNAVGFSAVAECFGRFQDPMRSGSLLNVL